MDNITINIVQVATELAKDNTIDEILNPIGDYVLLYGFSSEDDLYEFDEEGNSTYKEEVQDIFNKWYDYYYSKLEKLKI